MNATKERFGEADLANLFHGASKIFVAKGKKVLSFDAQHDEFDEITKVALGPSGNLRAPSVRRGKTWIIGFSEAAYAEVFD